MDIGEWGIRRLGRVFVLDVERIQVPTPQHGGTEPVLDAQFPATVRAVDYRHDERARHVLVPLPRAGGSLADVETPVERHEVVQHGASIRADDYLVTGESVHGVREERGIARAGSGRRRFHGSAASAQTAWLGRDMGRSRGFASHRSWTSQSRVELRARPGRSAAARRGETTGPSRPRGPEERWSAPGRSTPAVEFLDLLAALR